MGTLRDSSPIMADPVALRREAGEWGYLFFRGLVAPAAVMRLRERVLPWCAKYGWLAPGYPPNDAVAQEGVEINAYGSQDAVGFLGDVLTMPEFTQLGDDPAILAVVGHLCRGPVQTRRGDVCRVFAPRSPETAAHQDRFYVRDAPDLWTVWLPLGECPRSLGGLAILRGSHHAGLMAHDGERGAPLTGGLDGDAGWATADYRCGDAVLFHGLTVHRGEPNRTANRLRLSVDYRYQPASDAGSAIEERS